jgi:hypothetical protein
MHAKRKREKEGILDAVESVECPNHHDGNWNINATQRDAIARCYQIRRAPTQRRWKPGNRSIVRHGIAGAHGTRKSDNTGTGIACSSDNFVMFVCLHHRSCGPVKHCRVVEHSGKSRWSYSCFFFVALIVLGIHAFGFASVCPGDRTTVPIALVTMVK